MVTHDERLAHEAKRTIQIIDGVIANDEANGE
jgi:ABC-type lipoprotein export system ATPase subunit